MAAWPIAAGRVGEGRRALWRLLAQVMIAAVLSE